MYQINKDKNQCTEIEQVTFSELGFKERDHLQEWFAKNPSMFGEDLLIIQKEFDGFSDTRERLDLLALDKLGNLVIIENKLDDSGRDVTWQSLKYASYCSSLSKENIRSIYQDFLDKNMRDELAENSISDFIGLDYDEVILNQGSSQRVILVAAKFRKEVTSTVIWLMNYNLNIKCIKVTPYRHGDDLFLDVNQIIPVKDVEDYTISMLDKQADEKITKEKNQSRHIIRYSFWQLLLERINRKTHLFSNISPSKENWISTGTGISGMIYGLVVTKAEGRVELYFDTGSKVVNENAFDYFESRKSEIESALSLYDIKWHKLLDKKACRIYIPVEGNYFDENQWDELISRMIDTVIDFNKVLLPLINDYKKIK